MTAGIESASRLRRISAALREGRPIDPDDAVPLADALDAYFDGGDLLAALGIASQGRGGVSARRAVLLAERDDAMHELAGILGGEVAGEDSEAVWNTFEALGGYLDPDIRDRERERAVHLVEEILRARSGKPLTRRSISNILRS